MFMGLSSGESRSLIFCPNTEQRIFQMQFVIWVLKVLSGYAFQLRQYHAPPLCMKLNEIFILLNSAS